MRGKPIVSKTLRKVLHASWCDEDFIELARACGFKVRCLGSGANRTGYLVVRGSKKLVVKRRAKLYFRPRSSKVNLAPRVFVSGWEVQHFYQKSGSWQIFKAIHQDKLYNLLMDAHKWNFGFDTDGTLVCFDGY